MNQLEQLIWDHLAAAVDERPYVEVASLLYEDPFVVDLADDIRSHMMDFV